MGSPGESHGRLHRSHSFAGFSARASESADSDDDARALAAPIASVHPAFQGAQIRGTGTNRAAEIVKRYLNDRDPLAITRGRAPEEEQSQESSANEDAIPAWNAVLKSPAKAHTAMAPSSPSLQESPSTSSLPSLHRVGHKLDRSSVNALEALDKAISECAAASECEHKDDADRQRARSFQKNIRPAIDILRVNSVAGSSYSMLGSAKGRDDLPLVRAAHSLEQASPRPLWMDMVERRQEAWLSAASAGNLPIKTEAVYNAAADSASIEQQSVPHIVMLDSEWATSTSRGNGSTLLLKLPPLDAPSPASPEPFVAPMQATLDQLRDKWNSRMSVMGQVAIPKKKKGKPFLLAADSSIPIHGTVVYDRIRSVDARQLTCGVSLPELIERLGAHTGLSQRRDSDELSLPTIVSAKDLPDSRACKFVVARTNMSGDSELGPDASVDAHPCLWEKQPDFLEFESRFESGNLRRAVKISGTDNEYDLVLSPDMNTYGHTQWFFFRVRGLVEGQHYKFNIVNLEKSDSLYNMGLRPLMFSERTFAMQGMGWFRCGHNIAYFSNGIRRLHRSKTVYYQTLTFTVSTPYANDTIYLAHCYPYTFSMLKEYVHKTISTHSDSGIIKCKPIGESLAGNDIFCLTVTNFKSSPEAIRARRGVLLSARVHPGESNSSYMMKGAIDFILGSSPEAQRLREVFVFKIVPMINPDGVACGNYRCSLSGNDLNRRWKNPEMIAHPEIYNLKIMLKRFQEDRSVVMFCDLHGHSRKYNTFIYACNPKYWKSFFPASDGPPKYLERLVPKVLNKLVPSFSYDGCAYSVSKSKEGTGRVTVWKEFKIFNAFTMEASFAGTRGPSSGMESAFSISRVSGVHYGRSDLEELGSGLCIATCLVWASDSAVGCSINDRVQNISKARGDHDHVTSGLAEILALSDSDGDGQDSSSDDNVILDPSKILGGENLKSKMLSMKAAMAFKQGLSFGTKVEKQVSAPSAVDAAAAAAAAAADARAKRKEKLKSSAKPMRCGAFDEKVPSKPLSAAFTTAPSTGTPRISLPQKSVALGYSDATALFDVTPGVLLDKSGSKTARTKLLSRGPIPIISTVSVPMDEIPHVSGFRQHSSVESEFQQSARHSAKLTRLLTAGTKSLLSMITSESSASKNSSSGIQDAKRHGEEWNDFKHQIIGEMQGQHQLLQGQQQQQQQNSASFDVLRLKMQSLDFDLPPTAQASVTRVPSSRQQSAQRRNPFSAK